MAAKALQPGSLVLITGVNGYVGGHVAIQLLELGYKVRGTVRDQAKLDVVTRAFGKYPGKFEGVIISDLSTEDAFAHIAKGVDGVIHVASDVSFAYDPNVIVPAMIKATENALVASDKEKSVKRFVYTSSTVAAIPAEGATGTINAESWNLTDTEKAWAPPPYTQDRAMVCYAASKVGAEQAAWKFVKEKKPHFVLNTVLPSLCLGPKAFEGQNLSTSGWFNSLNTGDEYWTNFFLSFPPVWTVDIRDVARLHVAALLDEDVQNQRILSAAESGVYSEFIALLSKINPKHPEFPAPSASEAKDSAWIDHSPGEKLLQREGREGFITLETTLREQLVV